MKNGFLPAVLKTATLLLSACGGGNSNGNSDVVTPPSTQSAWPEHATLRESDTTT
jgi:hypothetical protein